MGNPEARHADFRSAADIPRSVWKYRFLLGLLLIVVAGVVLRVPGLIWLQDIVPEANFTFHPDEERFIKWAADFERKPDFNYVQGMTTHLYVIRAFAKDILGAPVDLVVALRVVSLAYAVLLLGLVGIMVRSLTSSTKLALLTAGFLAVAPVHIVSSHFGTADSASAFWFLMACFLGWHFAKTRSELSFIACSAAVGIAIAVKFLIALVPMLGVMVLLGDRKLYRASTAFVVAGMSFLATNFFSFTPWDAARFLRKMISDVGVVETSASSHVDQILYYSHSVASALGLAATVCLAIGLTTLAVQAGRRLRQQGRAALPDARTLATHPLTVLAIPFLVHVYLALGIDIRNARYILPIYPLLCLVAAIGVMAMARMLRTTAPATVALLVAVFGYELYNAVGLERSFQNDIRYQAARWIEDNLREGDNVSAFMDYSRVEGVHNFGDTAAEVSKEGSEFFVTSDLEYNRYFKSDSADEIYHAYGGQARLEFFQDLFAGRGGYERVAVFDSRPLTIEQQLIDAGFLVPLGTFIPGRYIIFQRLSGSS